MTDKELAGMRRRAGDMACKFSGRTVLRLLDEIDALTAENAEMRAQLDHIEEYGTDDLNAAMAIRAENQRLREIVNNYWANGCLRCEAPCSHRTDDQQCSTCRIAQHELAANDYVNLTKDDVIPTSAEPAVDAEMVGG